MRLSVLAFGAAVLAAVPLVAVPAHAAVPKVQITQIRYNSPGPDRGGNASLNAEYIRFKNTTRKPIDLTGWTLRDNAWRYTFENVVLRPGKTITLHSGRGRDSTSHLYWGRRWYVWNNDKDVARLEDADGRLVDKCSYSNRYRDRVTC